MPRKGKKLETLVALLESTVLPTDAVVKSPDYINDKETGRPREVDISIKYKVGTISLLLILECRDRKAKQGAPWVEEIIGKMKSVNADKAIMISSSGFAEPAKIKAKLNGIELRSFEQINKKDIESWFKVKFLHMTYYRYEVQNVSVDIFGNQGLNEEIIAQLEKYRNISGTDEQFKIKTDDRVVSLNYIFWDSLNENSESIFSKFPEGESNKVAKQFNFNFTNRDSCFQLISNQILFDIKKITLSTFCWRELKKIPISKFFKYQDSDGTVLFEGVEFKLKYSGNNKKLVISQIIDESEEQRKIVAQIIDD